MAYVKFKPLTAELNYTSVVSKDEIEPELIQLFDPMEEVFIVCKATRDLVVLTNKRIMILDRKGVRGFRRQIYSVMYRSISTYSIDIHNFNTAIELITDSGYQLVLTFSKPIPLETMFDIYKYISSKLLEK